MLETVSASALLDKAAAMVPTLRARAEACEALGRLPEQTVADLVDAGFARALVPRAAGGLGLSPGFLVELGAVLGRGCASTAWVNSFFVFHNWVLCHFPERSREEVFGGGPWLLSMVLNGTKAARLTPVADGYRLTGHWSYCSGIDAVRWAVFAAFDADNAVHMCLLPQSELRIDHDSWRVLGMRGTGSKETRAEDIFVPAHRVVRVEANQIVRREVGELETDPSLAIPKTMVFILSVAAVAVGIARGVIDDALATVRRRMVRVANVAQAADPATHLRLGGAVGLVDVAETALRAAGEDLLARARRGEVPDVADRVRHRNLVTRAVRDCVEAVDMASMAMGGSAIAEGGTVERAIRDIRTIASHFMLGPDAAAEQVGRVLLGLEPNSAF